MKATELKTEITSRYGARILKTVDSKWLLNECARLADNQEISHSVYTACYGILWAMATGRLSGSICIAIRDMNPKATFQLIADTVAACPTIGDVPSYLIRTLGK